MNLISTIKSLFQMVFCLILKKYFNDKLKYQIKNDSFSIINLLSSLILRILFIIFYFIISFFQIIYVLKITEVSRPSYNLIPLFFSSYIYRIIEMYFNKLDIMFFMSFTPSIFGILIFCETIIFKCLGFDKYTIYTISQRGNNEALNDIGSFSENSFENF